MLPLNDSQKYDLVVDKDGKLERVSIKTTQGRVKSGNFQVQLKNTTLGSDHNTIRRFDNLSCDTVFVVTIEGTMYEIPSKDITATCSLTLGEEYDKYIVTFD